MAAADFEEVKNKIENVDVVIFGTVGPERIETQANFLSQKTMATFLFRLAVVEIGIPVIFSLYACCALVGW